MKQHINKIASVATALLLSVTALAKEKKTITNEVTHNKVELAADMITTPTHDNALNITNPSTDAINRFSTVSKTKSREKTDPIEPTPEEIKAADEIHKDLYVLALMLYSDSYFYRAGGNDAKYQIYKDINKNSSLDAKGSEIYLQMFAEYAKQNGAEWNETIIKLAIKNLETEKKDAGITASMYAEDARGHSDKDLKTEDKEKERLWFTIANRLGDAISKLKQNLAKLNLPTAEEMAEAAKSSVSDIDNVIPKSDLAKLKDSMQITTREFKMLGKDFKKVLIAGNKTNINYCLSDINNFFEKDGSIYFTAQKNEDSPIFYSVKLELKDGEVIKYSKQKSTNTYTQPHSYPLPQETISYNKPK